MMTNGRKKGYMSDINVTPLVDVMLVLLVIFMVTAPMMMQGVEIDLPQTESKSMKTQEDPLILTVNKDQEVFLENRKITIEELESKISSIFKYRSNKEILLRADASVPYGFVIKVMAGVKRAGIEHLGMVTEPLD